MAYWSRPGAWAWLGIGQYTFCEARHHSFLRSRLSLDQHFSQRGQLWSPDILGMYRTWYTLFPQLLSSSVVRDFFGGPCCHHVIELKTTALCWHHGSNWSSPGGLHSCCTWCAVLWDLWWVSLSSTLCLFLSRWDFSFLQRFFRSWRVRNSDDSMEPLLKGTPELRIPC